MIKSLKQMKSLMIKQFKITKFDHKIKVAAMLCVALYNLQPLLFILNVNFVPILQQEIFIVYEYKFCETELIYDKKFGVISVNYTI